MFASSINSEFAQFIKDGKISCTEEEFRERLVRIVANSSDRVTTKPKRSPSKFVVFRKSVFENLKLDYFGDFDEWEDWSETGVIKYYDNKGLPKEKLTQFISKQKAKDKDTFKPKLVALISIKAGLMWGEMTDSDKSKYADKVSAPPSSPELLVSPEAVGDSIQTVIVSTNNSDKKKGRPKGKQPVKSVSNAAIKDSFDDDNVELDEFEYKGTVYYRDDSNVVYTCDEMENITRVGMFANGSVEFDS